MSDDIYVGISREQLAKLVKDGTAIGKRPYYKGAYKFKGNKSKPNYDGDTRVWIYVLSKRAEEKEGKQAFF